MRAATNLVNSPGDFDFGKIDCREILRSRFGLKSFRQGQLRAIRRLLSGRNVAVVFPTGGGKSLCYQLPSLVLPGITVVVSPLIALMKDQCDSLAAKGIEAVRLDSSMSSGEYRDAMEKLRLGKAKLLYVAPERLFNERFIESVRGTVISLFAIDEAHCISQWGHNFRPDYLKLASIAASFSAERILALTATATPEVLKDIRTAFKISKIDAIRTAFYRPNLQLKSVITTQENQYPILLSRLRTRPAASTLVYVTTQKIAEVLAEQLTADGIVATAYHAGLETEHRSQIQHSFLKSKKSVIVATIAFGMGIDKANIRYVYHFNPPKSLEAYAQEIGRAGRDRKDAICEMIIAPEDRIVLDNFTYGDTPEATKIERLIDLLNGHRGDFHVSHYQLSSASDIRILVVRTLMTYLELDGYLQATSVRYENYKIQPRVTSESIAKHYKGDERVFVETLLSMLTKGRIWFRLNLSLAARRLETNREQIVSVIQLMAEKGWLEIKASDVAHGYRWSKSIRSARSLAAKYAERMERRESNEIRRLDDVFSLAESTRCLAETLSAHFGEPLDATCGRCSFCLGEGPFELPPQTARPLGRSARMILDEMIQKYPQALVTVRDQARFLCGLSSPAMVRARITRELHFGVCREMPFMDILKALRDAGPKR